jgi:hypothetical protein
MEKAQWKALYDFSNEVGLNPGQLVSQLKEMGIVDKETTPKNLDRYCKGTSYTEMINFLRENY